MVITVKLVLSKKPALTPPQYYFTATGAHSLVGECKVVFCVAVSSVLCALIAFGVQ